ncbi:MAG: hypothetical protein LW863_15895, partial [Flammeovirgaceae bacterium]|nr:hypothetical protein [Flammeovirgaceae bacterium]
YYDDCDAVVFCWKLGEDPDKPPRKDDDSFDENDDPQNIYKKQQKMLDDVRKSIPDDIPFLIFVHIFGNANTEVVDKMYTPQICCYHTIFSSIHGAVVCYLPVAW